MKKLSIKVLCLLLALTLLAGAFAATWMSPSAAPNDPEVTSPLQDILEVEEVPVDMPGLYVDFVDIKSKLVIDAIKLEGATYALEDDSMVGATVVIAADGTITYTPPANLTLDSENFLDFFTVSRTLNGKTESLLFAIFFYDSATTPIVDKILALEAKLPTLPYDFTQYGEELSTADKKNILAALDANWDAFVKTQDLLNQMNALVEDLSESDTFSVVALLFKAHLENEASSELIANASAADTLFWEVYIENLCNTLKALPDAKNVKLTDADAIKAARAAYDKLTTWQKEFFLKEHKDLCDKLTACEAALKKLTDAQKGTDSKTNTGKTDSGKKDTGKDIKSPKTSDTDTVMPLVMAVSAASLLLLVGCQLRKKEQAQ